MADQLASNLDTVRVDGSEKPSETPLHPRTILGDNLPANQAQQAQTAKKTTPVVSAASTPLEFPTIAANDNGDASEALTVERLVLRALFGGSSFSFQAQMLKSRRQRAQKGSRRRKSPNEIMLEHARSVIGNPDQDPATAKKAA